MCSGARTESGPFVAILRFAYRTGAMMFADGESYVGDLRDGRKEGKGKSILADG